MDDHKDNQTDARRREENVLEQRYKELYGNAATAPEDAVDVASSDAPDGDAFAALEEVAEATPDASPEAVLSETPAKTESPAAPEDISAKVTPQETARVAPASENRAARRTHTSPRPPRAAAAWEDDTPLPRPSRKEPSARAATPKDNPKLQKTKQPDPEPSGKRPAPGRRVDTLERSQVRRSYGQPPKQQMKLWPWLLAGGIIVVLLVGLLVFSMLRPLPGQSPNVQDTPMPTSIPAGLFGQPTVGPTTDLSGILPTPDPTIEPTDVPSTATATPDTSTILRPGTSGESVRLMQRRLIELGYMATGTDDGEYGNTTQSAVVAFQKAHDLTADGYAGQQTLTLLYNEEAQPFSPEE